MTNYARIVEIEVEIDGVMELRSQYQFYPTFEAAQSAGPGPYYECIDNVCTPYLLNSPE